MVNPIEINMVNPYTLYYQEGLRRPVNNQLIILDKIDCSCYRDICLFDDNRWLTQAEGFSLIKIISTNQLFLLSLSLSRERDLYRLCSFS
jgi:hypothetical protein